MTNDQEQVLLTLTLPSGKTCRVRASRRYTGEMLIDTLISKGILPLAEYEFCLEYSGYSDPYATLDEILMPGVTEAAGRITELQTRPFHGQLLYGCPTAVTEQADRLTDCTVTRTEL